MAIENPLFQTVRSKIITDIANAGHDGRNKSKPVNHSYFGDVSLQLVETTADTGKLVELGRMSRPVGDRLVSGDACFVTDLSRRGTSRTMWVVGMVLGEWAMETIGIYTHSLPQYSERGNLDLASQPNGGLIVADMAQVLGVSV